MLVPRATDRGTHGGGGPADRSGWNPNKANDKGVIVSAIKVTSEQLRSVSGQLSTGSDSVEQQLSSMESQVKALVDADWNGAASDSFRDLYDKWHTGAKQVKEALDGISQMLGNAATAYQETEDQLRNQMSG